MSFGLVAAPVKVYTASGDPDAVEFNMMHACGSRLRSFLKCEKDGEIVPRDQSLKGYEFSKGQYVTFSKDEIKALETARTKMIAIDQFVPATSIDLRFVEKPYYLGPDKGGEKAFWLLYEALKQRKMAAIASYAVRGKDYLVAVMPVAGTTLGMFQLRYEDEVRSAENVGVTPQPVNEAELKLGLMLIDQKAAEAFDPSQYVNDTKSRQMAKIKEKVETGTVSTPEPEQAAASVDLMAALEASLAA